MSCSTPYPPRFIIIQIGLSLLLHVLLNPQFARARYETSRPRVHRDFRGFNLAEMLDRILRFPTHETEINYLGALDNHTQHIMLGAILGSRLPRQLSWKEWSKGEVGLFRKIDQSCRIGVCIIAQSARSSEKFRHVLSNVGILVRSTELT